jgi:hypothetical protein
MGVDGVIRKMTAFEALRRIKYIVAKPAVLLRNTEVSWEFYTALYTSTLVSLPWSSFISSFS